MDIESQHERIEAYLAGNLNTADRETFEQELAMDDTLRAEVERHRKADVVIRHGLRLERKRHLREIDKTLPTLKIRRIGLYPSLAAAAAILLLIVASGYIYTQQIYSHTAIAGRLYVPAPVETYRGTTSNEPAPTTQLLSEAQASFEAGDYPEAVATYLTIIQTNDLFREQAEWNLLLCYLASDPSGVQFKTLLDHLLQNPAHAFHANALTLVKTMQSPLYRMAN